MTLDLARDTIFVTLAGSQAHGTARAGSDVDLRGVCVAPLELRVSPFRDFEQFEGALEGPLWAAVEPRIHEHPTARFGVGIKTEAVVFDVAKFLRLCATANPNALEILFADERDWVYVTPAWRRIHRERKRFLSREVQQTYLGYALSQLKRIRTHRSWLLSPPERKPSRADFGLPDASTLSRDDRDRLERSIAERVRSYGIADIELPEAARTALEERLSAFWLDRELAGDPAPDDRLRSVAARALKLPDDVAATLEAERKYRAALKQWGAYEAWKRERNPARADLERRFGYDTKHAMHLVRLMRTGLEILSTGELSVRRADAAELVDIREGALTFDALEALAHRLELEMREALRVTSLPANIDHGFVEALAVEVILSGHERR